MDLKTFQKEFEHDKAVLDSSVRAYTLAAACYWWWCDVHGWTRWQNDGFRLYNAIDILLKFIGEKIVLGQDWIADVGVMFEPDAPHYYLYELLDKSGKFSQAARWLMYYVVAGEAKLSRRGRIVWEDHQIDLF